ncbi:MAG: hypothetical protein JNM14_15305 [Ferruginibacter sp.]|nr:hypothetical protein [Ferruginibacter sp.]
MASNSETGHVKNVANLKTLNGYLASLGAQYNPSKKAIELPQLQQLHTDAENALAAIQAAFPPYHAAVDAQEAAFANLDKLVTRLVRAYKSAIENPAEAETVISLQKLISGRNKKKPNPEEEPRDGKDPISESKRSYDNRQANFQALIKTMAANPNYKPNETELQITTIQAYADELKAKTEAVDAVSTPIINGRIARNKILYADKTGFIPGTIKAIKDYIISVFGAGSPQIKYINTLKFKSMV